MAVENKQQIRIEKLLEFGQFVPSSVATLQAKHPVVDAFLTGMLAVVGIKLPGLEFKNQRVEAAYRKELVYGEDDETRATPPTVRELFSAVRRNYFRLYFHYMYFNIARILYLQVDNVFGLFLLFPSIVAGTITLGLMTQITNVFGQVRGSFQYLINSWTTLVELMSIYKRLRSFERELDGQEIQEVTHTLS